MRARRSRRPRWPRPRRARQSARWTRPQDSAGPDDPGVDHVPADAAEQVPGDGNHPAELAGPGRGGWHAEYHADDHDLAARHRPDRGEGQPPALRGSGNLTRSRNNFTAGDSNVTGTAER